MAETHSDKNLRHPLRKKLLKWGLIVFLSVLFLEFLFYFGSNFLLKNWAQRKLNQATNNVYVVDFNRVYFSLIRRGVFLDGIIMKPIAGRTSNNDKTLFDLSLDELRLNNLWYDFGDRVIYVGNLEFINPNLSIDLPTQQALADSVLRKRESPVKALERELKNSITGLTFSGVYIKEIEINNADLFFLNFLSDKSLQAENTRLVVRDLDWTKGKEWDTPFNAAGFEFNLENVHFPLPGDVHAITANKVLVSSIDNIIDIDGFVLSSDKQKASKAYYDMSIPGLRVGNVDLNEAFQTSEVRIDEIVLKAPDFKVLHADRAPQDSTGTEDLNQLIDGILRSFEVRELSVNDGRFVTSEFQDTLQNRIEIQEMDFKMINFYLSADSLRRESQFFYGEDAAIDIENAQLYLSDNVHLIKGERVSVSSFKDQLVIDQLLIVPREDAAAESAPENLLRISVPYLELNKANLKELYRDGVFNIDEVIINSPTVEITELLASSTDSNDSEINGKLSVPELLRGYMDEVSIRTFDLKDGEVQFQNRQGVRSDDMGFERFSILLEDVLFRPNEEGNVRNQVIAKEMLLSLDKYHLKLKDNLHEFLADRVLIDSKNSRVVISNFILQPNKRDSIQYILDTYNKSVVLDVHIPEFRLEGVDLLAAYRDEKLLINQILVPSPVANFTRYRTKARAALAAPQMESAGEIKDLLTSYFSYIQIDSVSFSDGQLLYQTFAGPKNIYLSEDSLSLQMKGFLMEKGVATAAEKTFFSDEIDLTLSKYEFSVAGGNYEVSTDGIRFNSKTKSIEVENLVLHPAPTIDSKIALSLTLPRVSLEGVDVESFLFENKLELDNLLADGSVINLEVNKSHQETAAESATRNDSEKTLPKSIEIVSIGNIVANNSKMRLNYRVGKDDFESIQTDFDLSITELNLDSATNAKKDITGLFEAINLKLEDFSYALPDSIHTVHFSSVYLDNFKEETVFSDVVIQPRINREASKGTVISAKVKEVGIQYNTLREMQLSGVFDLEQLRLNQPEIAIYLEDGDSTKARTTKTKKVEPNGEALINSLLLRDVLIASGELKMFDKNRQLLPKLGFQNINLHLQDLNLDLLKQEQKLNPQLLEGKDLTFSFSDYQLYTKDSLNKLQIGDIRYSDRNIHLDNVRFGPTKGRYEYLRSLGYQADAIDAWINNISLNNIDFQAYFIQNKIIANSVNIDGLTLNVFRDKRMPQNTIRKPMPQELMQNSPIELAIDSAVILNSQVTYQEFTPKSMLPGGITFEDLHANITPFILSTPAQEYPAESLLLAAKTNIMGVGNTALTAEMFFQEKYPMDVQVKLGAFDLNNMNDLLSKSLFIQVSDGKVTNGEWDFRMNEEEAWGNMTFKYKDLKVEFLDSLTLERGRGKLGFMTFLANTFINSNNPRKLFKRTVKPGIYYKRDQSKFIFGGWWRATLSGLRGSIGLGQANISKKLKEEEEE